LRDVVWWFMIFGVVTFWILIPTLRQVQSYRQESA
jgi:hypothetical protein